MSAAVASANNTSSFQLSVDGKNITEEIAVPAATTGEDNFDEYNVVTANVELTEGEHILRFTVTSDWMDIDYINFSDKEKNEEASTPKPGTETEPEPGLRLGKVNFVRSSAESLKVFSMTGKFLGRLEMQDVRSARGMSEGLRRAGYVQGVYLVRGGGVTQRVRVDGK